MFNALSFSPGAQLYFELDILRRRQWCIFGSEFHCCGRSTLIKSSHPAVSCSATDDSVNERFLTGQRTAVSQQVMVLLTCDISATSISFEKGSHEQSVEGRRDDVAIAKSIALCSFTSCAICPSCWYVCYSSPTLPHCYRRTPPSRFEIY